MIWNYLYEKSFVDQKRLQPLKLLMANNASIEIEIHLIEFSRHFSFVEPLKKAEIEFRIQMNTLKAFRCSDICTT